MIFYSRESSDFELFEKQHHGTQKSNKSNKNNTLPKCTFLALWLKNAKSRLPPEWVRLKESIFFLKEFLCVWTRRNFYIGISGPVEYSTTFRPISATLSKFEFWAKIDFLANFGIFDFSKYDLPFGRKWPEIWLVAGNCLFGPPKHFYITYMIFYDH